MDSLEPDQSSRKAVEGYYQDQLTTIESEVATVERQSEIFSRFRGLTFFSAVGLAIWGALSSDYSTLLYMLAGLVLVGFVVLAALHEHLLEKLSPLRHRMASHQLQLARISRDWDSIDVPTVALSE